LYPQQPRKLSGLLEADSLQIKLNHHRIFVRLLNKRMTKRVEHFDCTVDDSENFFLEHQLFVIRIY